MWGNSCSSSKRVHEMESLSVEIWCDGKHSQFPVVRERPTPPINYHATKKRRKKKAAPPPLDEFPSRPFFKKRDGQNNENGVPLENKKKKKNRRDIFRSTTHRSEIAHPSCGWRKPARKIRPGGVGVLHRWYVCMRRAETENVENDNTWYTQEECRTRILSCLLYTSPSPRD